MKIDIQDKGPVEKIIDMTLETADIGPKIKSELNKIRAKTDIKGFRKGKTPMSFVKRTYGKQVAIEVISEASQTALNELLTENNFDLINQPLLLNSNIPAIQDGGLDEECTFQYMIGLMPDITLEGVSDTDAYTYYSLKVGEDKVDERLTMMQKQLGTQSHPENIQDEDVVEVDIEELDGDKVKEDGHDSNFKFAVDLIGTEDLKKKVLTLAPGDTFDFDVYDLERDRNEEYVHKYFLKLKEDENAEDIGKLFRATIAKVHRQEMAELNDEFFEKGFPPEITNEEEARAEIRKQYTIGYASVGDNMLIKEVVDTVTNNSSFDLPNEYIKELMKSNNDDPTNEEEFVALQDNVRRQIIISLLIKKLNIEITQDDMREKVMQEFTANFGGMSLPPETIDKIVSNAMQDGKYARELSDRVLNDKLIAGVKSAVKLDDVAMEEDALMKLYDETFPKNTSEEEE